MSMETRSIGVRFVTPAFLGNAEQSGQWRTPPFKALLRQWWRVAVSAEANFSISHQALCQMEGTLFGTAAGKQGQRSRVRIRLSRWDEGQLRKTEWTALGAVEHPEVKQRGIDAGLYLGYGPVEPPRGQQKPTLKRNAAIQADEEAVWELAFPAENAAEIDRTLGLIHRFGTLGGRSRNGWGSLQLEGGVADADLPLRDWKACLDRDWVHAIGRDEQGPLVWQTRTFGEWKSLMVELARIKVSLRTQFRFTSGRKAPRPEERHWLSYPVTNHDVRGWGNKRLPNTLRFKVCATADGKLRGLVFHTPCMPPKDFSPSASEMERIWRKVHRYLDGAGLERIGG